MMSKQFLKKNVAGKLGQPSMASGVGWGMFDSGDGFSQDTPKLTLYWTSSSVSPSPSIPEFSIPTFLLILTLMFLIVLSWKQKYTNQQASDRIQ